MKKLLYVLTGLCLLVGVFTGCEKPEKQSVIEDLNIEMVYVEGGTFEMGATAEQEDEEGYYRDDARPVRIVKLDSYYIGKYEVTQAQWKAVMGTTLKEQADKTKSIASDMPLWEWPKDLGLLKGEGDNYPMYYVSWGEAQEFCKRLSKKTGKKYMLPTEAQWEYAARGGNKSNQYKYAGSNDVDVVAWYQGNSDKKTHPVGMRKANALGIYDMSGNVWELCSDWYASSYDEKDTDNPQGPASGSNRACRGGSCLGDAVFCLVSSRGSGGAFWGSYECGFRVACISE